MNLREIREENKKSRQEVADILGITPNAVTNYERGIRSINIEQVLLLAKLYDISAEEVIRAQQESIRVGNAD